MKKNDNDINNMVDNFEDDDPVFPEIKEYYGLDLPRDCFLSR